MVKMGTVLYGNIYKSWSYNTAPLTSRLIHRGGSRRESNDAETPGSCVSGQEKQRKRRKRAGWTGSVYGSIRVLNRTSDFWSRVELVENVGLPAEPQSLSSDFKRRTSDHVVCKAVWRQAFVNVCNHSCSNEHWRVRM